MEITSRLNRWLQSALRPCWRPGGRRRLAGIAVEPVVDHVVVELLRPEQPGIGLPADAAVVVRCAGRDCGSIELVRLADAVGKHAVEVRGRTARVGASSSAKSRSSTVAASCRGDVQHVVRRGFRADCRRIDRVRPPVDDVIVKGVFDVRGLRCAAWNSLSLFVSLSVNNSVGRRPSGIRAGMKLNSPQASSVRRAPLLHRPAAIRGLGVQPSCRQPHDQVLRNQRVGSRCSVAASGPRLAAVTRIRMSFGDDLAYSTKTSK